MGLAVYFLVIIFIALCTLAMLITGTVLIITGTGKIKRGGKKTTRTAGVILLAIPLFIGLCVVGYALFNKARIKCVADKWRYEPFFVPRNSVVTSGEMLRELIDAVYDNDEYIFCREFSANVRDDRHFEDAVEEFFDDIEDLDVDLDPDDFLTDFGDRVHFNSRNSSIDGYTYSAQIEGVTYYCYLRVCFSTSGDKDDIGLQQFIVCSEDKVDELNEIIEDGDDDIYLGVL